MLYRPFATLIVLLLFSQIACRKPKPEDSATIKPITGSYSCNVLMRDIKIPDPHSGGNWNTNEDSLYYADTIILIQTDEKTVLLNGAYLSNAECKKDGVGSFIGRGISGGDTCTWYLTTYPQKDSMTLMFTTHRKYKTVIWDRVGKRIVQ